MSQAFKLPDLGEGIHEGEILEIPVSVGDTVAEDDVILTVETDKAAVDIPSPFAGKVEEIRVEEGDIVNVGDVMLTFSDGKDAEADQQGEESEQEEEQQAEASEKAKEDREEQEEGEKKTAEREKQKDTQKEAEARKEREEDREEEPETERQQKAQQQAKQKSEQPSQPEGERPVPASPNTRRIARELNVDLQAVEGSGPGGRVTESDVRAHAEEEPSQEREQEREEEKAKHKEKAPEAEHEEAAPPSEEPEEGPTEEEKAAREAVAAEQRTPELPDFSKWGEVEHIPLRSVRRATARRMTQSWSNIPHVNHHDQADITQLERLRQHYQQEMGVDNLTPTIFVMKAAAAALRRYPRFNASLDTAANEIIVKHYINIGVAVDTDRGLIVPVVNDVDSKGMAELAEETAALIQRTRNGDISREDMQGGTFTITNVGPIGGTHFDPIINFPQAAILGTARIDWQPVVRDHNGQRVIEPRLMLPLVLAFDHRIVDGAEAAHFMNDIVGLLEDPDRFMLRV